MGYNTDAPGIRAGFAARGAAPTGRALVIGNGGAARAARWALADRGVITAARRGGDVTMDQLPQAARQCRVVVNATPLGMEGFPPFADLSFLGSLPAGAAVFDLIYAPPENGAVSGGQGPGSHRHHRHGAAGAAGHSGLQPFHRRGAGAGGHPP